MIGTVEVVVDRIDADFGIGDQVQLGLGSRLCRRLCRRCRIIIGEQ